MKIYKGVLITLSFLLFISSTLVSIHSQNIKNIENEHLLEEKEMDLSNLKDDPYQEEFMNENKNANEESLITKNEKTKEITTQDKESLIEDEGLEERNLNTVSLEDTVLLNESIVSANAIENVEDLYFAIESASDGSELTLASNFIQSDISLEIPNKKITINGNGIVWTSGSFLISGNNSEGTLVFKNIKINAHDILDKVFILNHKLGTVILEEIEISNSLYGAASVSTSLDSHTVFNNVHIHNNKTKDTAPALFIFDDSKIQINNSTIENNIGGGYGYETGAISSKWFSGILEINNSVFRNNRNETINIGLSGGGGGALAFHYMQGDIVINNSIFDANETSSHDSNNKSTYDGGAIYILDGRSHVSGRASTFTVNGSTFSNNIAHDDGGAIYLQGTANPGFETSINYSTFYNNKAYGFDGANYSGGAIHYLKNGGSAKMVNAIKSSTFISNTSGNENTNMEQRGGAIGLSGAGIFAIAVVTRANVLMIGNNVYDANGNLNTISRYKDISNFTTVQDGKLNILNVDGGEKPLTTLKDLTGSSTILLRNNYSSIRAGVNQEIVQTIPMIPEVIADNSFEGENTLKRDQRGFSRYRDHGAVEQSWIKYMAEEDAFYLSPLEEYDGTIYYRTENDLEDNDKPKVKKFYDVATNESTSTVRSAQELAFIKEGYTLLGWSTQKDHQGIIEYLPGDPIVFVKENVTLYPVWEKDPIVYTIIYKDGVEGVEIFEDQKYIVEENTTTPLFQGKLDREGYTFVGWSPEVSETVLENVTYQALWDINQYTLTFDSVGGSIVDSQTIDYLEIFKRVEDPIKEGYVFTGWYLDKDYREVFDFDLKATQDLTVYAKWEKKNKPDQPERPSQKPESDINKEKDTPQTFVYHISGTVLYLTLIIAGLVLLKLKVKKSN